MVFLKGQLTVVFVTVLAIAMIGGCGGSDDEVRVLIPLNPIQDRMSPLRNSFRMRRSHIDLSKMGGFRRGL